MLELGDISAEAHASLGRRLAESRAAGVFLFGDEMAAAADALKKNREKNTLKKLSFFNTRDKDELSKAVDDYVKDGDLVLLKGSRGCELETLTDMLLGKESGDAHVS
jgi:UDP-N-acetylmuramoyl-tripeptide--D-alanyl-D-alanine ligase